MSKLVIVESPTKARTIAQYLGKDFLIESSYGHIRDLPKKELGVDTEHDFKPRYVIPTKARKTISNLKKKAQKSKEIILATDEDREGEAIAWHLTKALEIPKEKTKRIVFHEITKKAIDKALKNPRKIDIDLVDAQQARRVLDRLVGYKLSPFLWKKIYRGLSAGRVQSVTLRLIVDREREIEAFKPQEYWTIEAELKKAKDGTFTAKLIKQNGKSISKLGIKNKKQADEIAKDLKGAEYKVLDIKKTEKKRSPLPPFTTSTLQQDAAGRLGFSAKQTMMFAQQLYEGIEIGEKGPTGLCIDEDTLIIGKDGQISPIKELKDLQNVNLIGIDDKNLQIKTSKVNKFWKLSAPKKMIKITTEDNEELLITPDHPLMVLRRGKPLWVKGKDITANDYLAALENIPVQRQKSPPSLFEIIEKFSKTDQKKVYFKFSKDFFANNETASLKNTRNIIPYYQLVKLLKKGAISYNFIKKHYQGISAGTSSNVKFQKIDLDFSPKLGYLLGFIIGDGSLEKKRNCFSFSCKIKSKIAISKLNYLISKTLKESFDKLNDKNIGYRLNSTFLHLLFQYLGASKGKKSNIIDIPNILLTQPDNILEAYIAGLWDTDGSILKNYQMNSIRLGYSSKSKIFIEKLRLLLKTFGINSSKHKNKRTNVFSLLVTSQGTNNFKRHIVPHLIIKRGTWKILYQKCKHKYVKGTISYCQKVPTITPVVVKLLKKGGIPKLTLSKIIGRDFFNYIGKIDNGHTRLPFIQKPTLRRIAKIIDTPNSLLNNLANSPIIWKRIKRIKQIPCKKKYVYDVSTNNHTFIANGIVSHNCTYMRTDSLTLAKDFLNETQEFIKDKYGPKYGLAKPRVYKTKSKLAQEAHEAIRPTSPERTPESIKQYLDKNQYRLYSLIWQRTIACQMTEAIMDSLTCNIAAKNYIFRALGSTIKFDGFLKIYGLPFKEVILPPLAKDEILELIKLIPSQHFTQPPPRYTEASLVKTLEQNGIGRPSTYAPTISTIQERGYVEKKERKFYPKEIGILVNDLLVKHFPKIVDIKFTAHMEENLDKIAQDKIEWVPVVREFYEPFAKHLEKKELEVKKEEVAYEKTKEKCPKCGAPLIIKWGRFGRFLACSKYPECKYSRPLPEEEKELKKMQEEYKKEKCEKCGTPLQVKKGRYGYFLACSKYPECDFTKPILKKVGVKCPKCKKGDIIEKKSKKGRTFYACSRYPKCDFVLWQRPTGEVCPKCESLLVYAAKDKVKCSNKECDYTKEVKE